MNKQLQSLHIFAIAKDPRHNDHNHKFLIVFAQVLNIFCTIDVALFIAINYNFLHLRSKIDDGLWCGGVFSYKLLTEQCQGPWLVVNCQAEWQLGFELTVFLTWILYLQCFAAWIGFCFCCMDLKCSSHWVLLRNHESARQQASDQLVVEFVNPNYRGCWDQLADVARRTRRLLMKGGAVVVHCNSGHHRAPQIAAALVAGLRQTTYADAVAWQDYHDSCGCHSIIH